MGTRTFSAYWTRKMIGPLKNFLSQGLSPGQLAFSVALGITLGTIPVVGVTSILCAIAALVLRLNLPVIQFANYMVYPLQILLLVPYYHFGDLLFGTGQNMRFDTLKDMLSAIPSKETLTMLFDSTLNAIGAWFLISPVILSLLYAALRPVLVRVQSRSPRLRR